MPSLESLQNPIAQVDFDKAVAAQAIRHCSEEIDLNDGLINNQDLRDCIAKGDRTTFNFGRLIDEAGKYE